MYVRTHTDANKRRRDHMCVWYVVTNLTARRVFLRHAGRQVIDCSSSPSPATPSRWDDPAGPKTSMWRTRMEGRQLHVVEVRGGKPCLLLVYLGLLIARCVFVTVENKLCIKYIWVTTRVGRYTFSSARFCWLGCRFRIFPGTWASGESDIRRREKCYGLLAKHMFHWVY